jgi:hypothetical protein
MSLIVNGHRIPHAVLSAELRDATHDPIAEYCIEKGIPLTLPEQTDKYAHLPAPVAALRKNLDERADARKRERERLKERNAEQSRKNAPAGARIAAPSKDLSKAAPTQGADVSTPKSDAPAKGKE